MAPFPAPVTAPPAPSPHRAAHPAGILAEHPSAAPSGRLAASAAALSAPTMPAAGETTLIPAPLAPAPTQAAPAAPPWSCGWGGVAHRKRWASCHRVHTLPALLPSSWTQHPLIQKNHRVVLASFLLLLLGLGECPRGPPACPAYPHEGSTLLLLRFCTPRELPSTLRRQLAGMTPPPFYRRGS